MSNERRINAITAPIRADTSGFTKGLDRTKRDAEHFRTSTTRSFSLMGTGINDSLDKVQAKLKTLGGTNLGVLTKGIAGLAVAAVAAAGAIASIGFKRITELGKDAQALGVSAEALSRLQGVAKASSVDIADLGTFISGLTGKINDSIGHTTDAAQAFEALGTSAEALQKMTPEAQIKRLNAGFAALPNNVERSRVAMLLLGKEGMKVERILEMAPDKFKEAFDSAPLVTAEDVSEARKLEEALNRVASTVTNLAEIFTVKLAPAIESVADLLTGVAAKFGVVVPKVPTLAAPPVPRAAPVNVPRAAPVYVPKALPAPNATTLPAKAEAVQNQLFSKQAKAKAVFDAREAGKAKGRQDELARVQAKAAGIKAGQEKAKRVLEARELGKKEGQERAADHAKEVARLREFGVALPVPGPKNQTADQLQEQFDKEARGLSRSKAFVPSTNGGTMRRDPNHRARLDRHAATGMELNSARAKEKAEADAAKTQEQGSALAILANAALATRVNDLKDEHRQAIEGAGKDEITRRVDQLKGISAVDRKALITQGYRAREANKTSSLRDELQESTKTPIERLREEAARIEKMAKLGEANGGLSRLQAVRALAQKTAESGLGGQTQFAGALQANSIEGRSYLLSQMSRQVNDPIAVAREGLALTGRGNGYLSRMVDMMSQQRQERVVSF